MKTKVPGYLKVYLLIIPWLIIGCAPSSQVFTDYDKAANMEGYHTFGWLPVSAFIESANNPVYYNELNDKRIKNAVGNQLESRNYQFSNDPELLIHYHIVIQDKAIVRTDPYGYYYGPYWMSTETNLYEYKEGTLIIDLMDADTNSLVWRGWITSFLKSNNPEKMDESIDNAVRMIFAKYPSRARTVEPDIQ
jgi:Domain of unknown function (DUF4136)